MLLRFAALAPVVVVVVAFGCSGDVTGDSDCEPVTCRIACEHGFQTGADGCQLCACAPPPGGCEPVTCTLYCENGFAKGSDGCEICSCNTSSCPGGNPAGCVVNGCPDGSTCDTSRGCVSSSCSCDEASGSWVCTDDCGGGVCVPGGECRGPDPSGCISTGCPGGQICNQELGCFPSGCACDASTGEWGCTADCGGGVCVPDPAGCSEPDPTGCMQTGCPLDQVCMLTSGLCVPTWCTCDAQAGTWSCSEDCDGGLCVDA